MQGCSPLPGREKSSVTPRMKAHRSSSLLTNSGPLSRRIVFGKPVSTFARSSVATNVGPSIALSHLDRRRQARER